MHKARRIAIVAMAAVLVAGIGLVLVVVAELRRAHEWAHGGDDLRFEVEVRYADADSLRDTAAALGYRDEAFLPHLNEQAVVVRVRWTGDARDEGWYQMIALDSRATPARPLPIYGGWGIDGGTGSGWDGANHVLSKQYDWLAGTAPIQHPDGSWSDSAMAIGVPALETGVVTGVFLVPPEHLPFTDATDQVLVAVFYVDDRGSVRWARRVAG